MKYDANRPITAANCPTREALERKPGDVGFKKDSIHARHSAKKRQQRLLNLQRRQASGR